MYYKTSKTYPNSNPEISNISLSAAAIYMFSQVFNNTTTFPGIPLKSNQFSKEETKQELIAAGVIDTNGVSDKGEELVKALLNMQSAQFALVLNELAYFFDAKKTIVTKVVTIDNKYAIYYGQKSLELIAAIGSIKYLNTSMSNKEEKLQDQVISAIDLSMLFKEHTSISAQIISNSNLIYNKLWIDGGDSVITYDPTTSMLKELAGRDVIKEVFKLIQFGDEYGFSTASEKRKSSL